MGRNILWLDDYFEDFGELSSSQKAIPDFELRTDYNEVARRFPNTKIHAETALSGFVQRILDHERLARQMEPKNPGACKLDAIVIDVMIDNAVSTPIPKFDPSDRRIAFDEHGLPSGWDTLKFNQNGNDTGLKLAKYFIQKLESLNDTAVIFYTHRPINSELAQAIDEIRNTKLVRGFQKIRGIEPVYKLLEECGMS